MNVHQAEPAPAVLTDATARASYGYVLPILDRLREAGHEALLVGGGIRDLLLHRKVGDWDVATSAVPDVVLGLWPEAVPTGIRHGTVTLPRPEGAVEITTYRTEGPYTDGRRPDWVHYVSSLEEDLSRRDFTVNAMALDPASGLLWDPHHGVEDLRARRLRTVGDPDQRFLEDGLRPLRGIRLAAVLEFTLDPATLAAVSRARAGVAAVAMERVRGELWKLLGAARPSLGLDLMRETGLLDLLLPELSEGVGVEQNRYHAHDVFRHSLHSLDAVPPEKPLVRLAALLHDVGKPRTRKVVEGEGTFHQHEHVGASMVADMLDRLRFSRADRDRVVHLVREHMFHYTPEWSEGAVRRFLRRVGPENVPDLFDLRVADDQAHGTGKTSADSLAELNRRIDGVREREEALGVTDLAVDGRVVMNVLGMDPGPGVGRVLEQLLERVLEDPSQNTREALITLAREIGSSS